MSAAIDVVALKPVSVDGHSRVQGEVFTVAPIIAAALVFSQDVRFAEEYEKPAPPAPAPIVRASASTPEPVATPVRARRRSTRPVKPAA